MMMNTSYVNCDVGVDGGGNRGRVVDGWRAGVGACPYRRTGYAPVFTLATGRWVWWCGQAQG